MDALRVAYESAEARMHGVSFEAFARALGSADVHPVNVAGECVGAVIVNGNEIHACVLPKASGRWFTRREARILNQVIDRYGCATTSATTPMGVEFVRRLGFTRCGEVWKKETKYGH